MKVKTRRWEEVERKLFTPKEVAAAERFAEREILEKNLRELARRRARPRSSSPGRPG